MMKQLFKHAQRASIVLMAIFVLSCGDDDEEDQLPQVTSSFTQVVNNTTGVVTFTNTSTNATTYLWDLNDGTTSTAFEPVNTYTSGTYTVKLTASNSAGGTATSQNTFTVTVPGSVDATKPIITLVGEATINLTVGDPYTDQGATANDNLDGNITAAIVKGGATVNTATAGSYVITYNVKDAAGNAAIEVTRTVVVTAFDSGLLANGSFSIPNGQPGAAWFGNAFNVLNEGGTNFNFANILSPLPPNAFEINLSQVVALVQGKNYILSFEASSDRSRTIIAGIGLNEGAFTSASEIVNLTTAKQTFTLNLSTLAFGGANSRVLFDMGGELGVVVLDNVKLVLGPDPTCTAETVQSLSTADFNLTFKTDPGTAIISENTTYEYAANPNFVNTTNNSCFVGKIVKGGVQDWDNNQIIVDTKLDFTTKSGFKMKAYFPAAGAVLLKLEDKTNGGISTELSRNVTQANTWQELTFDFAPSQSNKYDKIVLFFDYGKNTNTYYFDDLKLYGTGSPSSPTTSAPTPPARDAADVISIYGGAPYTNLAGINYNPNWGQSGVALTNPSFNPGDGNLVLAYPNFNYQGTELGGNVDASAMNFLHVDIWVAAGTDRLVKVSPINTGPIEFLVSVPLTPGAWNSVDLPKSSFNGMDWSSIYQMKFDGQFNGNGSANTIPFDIYLDNIYFYKGAGGGPPAAGTELAVNGNFETGTKTGWTEFPNGGATFEVSTAEQNGGTYSGKLVAGEAQDVIIKQANLAAGTIANSQSVTIKFDLKGSLTGAGGVVFAEFFSELSGGGTSKAEILGGGAPLAPTSTWTTYTYTTTTATVGQGNVGGGVTLQLKAACGAVAGCGVVAYFDNVSVKIN